jgi:predicted metal-dependent phosphoesterase TrpH
VSFHRRLRLEARKNSLEVIAGVEYKTQVGHIVGLFIEDRIKSKDFYEIIDRIKENGGIVVIAHPYAMGSRRLKADIAMIKQKIDAVETFNARNILPFGNNRASRLCNNLRKACIGCSDAQFKIEIGNGMTMFDEKYDLRKAIQLRKTVAKGHYWMNPFSYSLTLMRNLKLWP